MNMMYTSIYTYCVCVYQMEHNYASAFNIKYIFCFSTLIPFIDNHTHMLIKSIYSAEQARAFPYLLTGNMFTHFIA